MMKLVLLRITQSAHLKCGIYTFQKKVNKPVIFFNKTKTKLTLKSKRVQRTIGRSFDCGQIFGFSRILKGYFRYCNIYIFFLLYYNSFNKIYSFFSEPNQEKGVF